MSDGTIEDYRTRLRYWISVEGSLEAVQAVEPTAKYESGQPKPFPGLSIVSPPGPESHQWESFYRPLLALRTKLLDGLKGVHLPVPGMSLHVTAADLIAGPRYLDAKANNARFDADIIHRVEQLWHTTEPVGVSLRWRLSGLAFFQHAIVALLEPFSESDYDPIIQLRDAIYDDQTLKAWGVRRPKPFMAHITLSYYGETPSLSDRQQWLIRADEFRSATKVISEPLVIDQVELRHFPDMSAYHRFEADPHLRFEGGLG